MSGLVEKFGHHFSETAVENGEHLVSSGELRLSRCSRDGVWGESSDGSEFSLRVESRRLIPDCSCGDFASSGLCSHLYGALCLAELQGELTDALKKNVSGKILGSAGAPAASTSEMNYDYDRRSREKKDSCVHGERWLEYERGAVSGRARPAVKLEQDAGASDILVLYFIRPPQTGRRVPGLTLELWWKQSGQAGCRPLYVDEYLNLARREDLELIRFLQAVQDAGGMKKPSGNQWFVPPEMAGHFQELAEGCADQFRLLVTEEGRKRLLHLRLGRGELSAGWYAEAGQGYVFRWQAGDCRPEELLALCPGRNGFVLTREKLLFCNDSGAWGVIEEIDSHGAFFSRREALELNMRFARETGLALSPCPPELVCRSRESEVRGRLFVRTARFKADGHEQLHADLEFDYDGVVCPESSEEKLLSGRRAGELIVRNSLGEEALRDELRAVGFRWNAKVSREEIGWKLLPEKLEQAVFSLVDQGWEITAEGKTYRRPVDKKMQVSSGGQDWFEVSGEVDFGGEKLPLPLLLQKMRSGQKAVRLDDGTYGILPREWLENFTALLELGEASGEKIRLRQEQAVLVQALLAERAGDAADRLEELVRNWREKNHLDGGAGPVKPPEDFRAVLRPYQQSGLDWLVRMGRSGLGCCLADDMGLGKTVQVLALLAVRYPELQGRPALIVLPRTLIFNWRNEAEKFYPAFRCLVYQGSGRRLTGEILQNTDLIFTTYGTLRQDALRLSRIQFSYCILDESQIIKNADSSTSQACRLIRADYRLAMTGTPVENNLNDLFSQLDFLNPGLLGTHFTADFSNALRGLSREKLERLQKAVCPFLLRRTKEEVVKDLPPRTEQILWCDMEPRQKLHYEELRDYYRQEMGQRKALEKAGKAAGGCSMDVLAALLRLRQAACHPGLVNELYLQETSGKLMLLMERLNAVRSAGHKALVFSQFTHLLHLVEKELQQEEITYCYLDGQTKDRGELVRKFQEDDSIGCFLISLKAGGVGLNLTAADYVFILDPWWNPAVEAQAVDRAYRIGQTRPVTAYRLITRGTVEEKVMRMQQQKRKLSRSVLDGGTDGGAIPSGEDLKNLLALD